MKLNKKLISEILVIGFIGYIGLTQVISAESNEAKTLKEWGVPSIKGKTPYKTVRRDYSDNIAGEETLAELYKVNNELIGVFLVTRNRKKLIYSSTYDKDWKEPLDLCLFDYEGHGKFTKISPDKDIRVPDWINNYNKLSNSSPVFSTKKSKIYHKSSCSELGSKDVKFDSAQQARKAGGKPCPVCEP